MLPSLGPPAAPGSPLPRACYTKKLHRLYTAEGSVGTCTGTAARHSNAFILAGKDLGWSIVVAHPGHGCARECEKRGNGGTDRAKGQRWGSAAGHGSKDIRAAAEVHTPGRPASETGAQVMCRSGDSCHASSPEGLAGSSKCEFRARARHHRRDGMFVATQAFESGSWADANTRVVLARSSSLLFAACTVLWFRPCIGTVDYIWGTGSVEGWERDGTSSGGLVGPGKIRNPSPERKKRCMRRASPGRIVSTPSPRVVLIF